MASDVARWDLEESSLAAGPISLQAIYIPFIGQVASTPYSTINIPHRIITKLGCGAYSTAGLACDEECG